MSNYLFSKGSINVWVSKIGTSNQGDSLNLTRDDLLLKKVQFDEDFNGLISTNAGSSGYLEVTGDTDPIEPNLIRIEAEGPWNTVKSFKLSGRAEDLGDRSLIGDRGQSEKDLEVYNFVHTDIRLSRHSEEGADITIDGAKRGTIKTTDENDDLVVGVSSNGAGWRNSFNVNTRDGDDTVLFRNPIDDYSYGNRLNVENGELTYVKVRLGDGDDLFDSSSLSTEDRVKAGDGDDIVHLGGNNDTAFGQKGDDVLFGGDHNDHLFGQRGDDHLVGGDGDDLLRGGKDNDLLIGDRDFRVEEVEHLIDFSDYRDISSIQEVLEAEGVAIRARNINKEEDRLTNLESDNVAYSNGGIGASAEAATRPSIDTETGYDPVTQKSELLEIDFYEAVDSLELDLSYFFDENSRADYNQNEGLQYRTYHNGNLVDEAIILASIDGSGRETILIDDSYGVFDRVELEGIPYNNDPNNAGKTTDSSDFLIEAIRYTYDDSQSGNDILRGGRGEDDLIGGAGDDLLIGGHGLDTAYYQGDIEDYLIDKDGKNVSIKDTVADRDGEDTVRSVENFVFNDVSYTLGEVLDSQTVVA